METVACDLCGADTPKALLAGAAWGRPMPPVAMVRCGRCGLMYLSPRPTASEVGQYYPDDYGPFRGAIEDEPHALMRRMRRAKLVSRRRLVEQHAPNRPVRGPDDAPAGGRRPSNRILDVGCSTGLFLHEMAGAGWEARGVELSPRAAAYARRRFGLDVFEGLLEDAPFDAASFDAVTFWDVLEHTFSATRALESAARLLRSGGIVALNVPNWQALDRRCFGPYWAGYDPPRHTYVFSRETLGRLFVKAALQPVAWAGFGSAYSYYMMVYSMEYLLEGRAPALKGPLSRLLHFPGVRFLFEPLYRVAEVMGRGGGLVAIARKA